MKIFLLAILIAISSSLHADEATSWGKVTEIWAGYQNEMVLFKLDIAHINPAGCGGDYWYIVNPGSTDANKFLSLLLTAQSRKSDVQVMLSDTECFDGRPNALRIGVKS